jgi:hypothetical protein
MRVLIYPNPVIDILILEFNTTFEGEIQVLDMNSRIVKQDNLAGSSGYELMLNEISSGSYVLKIFGRETVNYYHFVKQ